MNEHLAASEDPGHLDDGYAATTHEEFCDYIVRQLRRAATSDENRTRRTLRVQGAAASIGEPPSADTQFQILVTSTIAALLEDAKSRHIINAELDSFAYCAWFQSMLLGQLLTEPTQPDVERWLAIATPAALAPLRLATSSASNTACGDGATPRGRPSSLAQSPRTERLPTPSAQPLLALPEPFWVGSSTRKL